MNVDKFEELCLDSHLVSQLREYTRVKDIKNFIKSFMDWYINNNLKTNNFWLYQPYYINKNNEIINIPDNHGRTQDMCYYLTGKSEEDFVSLFYGCKCWRRYKNYLIAFDYDEKFCYSSDKYYQSNPQFHIINLDFTEVIE